MGVMVVNGAMLMCSFGAAPSSLIVLNPTVMGCNMPVGTIQDHIPVVNIPPFSMCVSPQLPLFQATGAPSPCVPAISSPWTPGKPTVMVNNQPALDNTCMCQCSYGSGVVTIAFPGQVQIIYT
jgi:hypothetical protein